METENIFLNAMTNDKVAAIEATKVNKAFMTRLLYDLNHIYHTVSRSKDEVDQNVTWVDARTVRQGHEDFQFIADAKGCRIVYKGLGYRPMTDYNNEGIKPMGDLYDKYGTSCDAGFSSDYGHGKFTITIPIDRDNYQEAVKDLIYCIEKEGFRKKF